MEVVGYLALLEGAELQNKRQQAGLTLRPRWSHTLPHRCMPGAWTDAHPCVSLRSHLSRDLLQYSQLLEDLLQYSQLLEDLLQYSQLLEDLLQYSQLLEDLLQY